MKPKRKVAARKEEKPIDRLVDAMTKLEQRIEVLQIAIDELVRKVEKTESKKSEWSVGDKDPVSDFYRKAYFGYYYWPNGKPKGYYNEDGTPIEQ